MKPLSENLVTRLTQADVVCKDCGQAYGKYSVGCSSTYEGRCEVCGETKPVTEVRDWGYLAKGIAMARAQANIKEQSKEVAKHLFANMQPIMTDEALEAELIPSYEQGEISCSFSEDEIAALKDMLGFVEEHEEYELDDPCKAAINKVFDLYDDHCVKYELSPAFKAYVARYGAIPGPDDDAKWEVFRDTYNWMIGEGSGNE
jgi:hypothetical protein